MGEEEGTVTDTPQTHAGFAEISGAPLYYEVTGVGQPLVLLHQGFADSRMFDDQVAAFAAHCQVIRYDRHGSGRSGVPSIPYTHHAALRDLLRHLDIARAAILGMSMGGAIAIDFTLAYPAMVDALIPVEAAVGGFAASDATLRQWGEIGAALATGDVSGAVGLTLRMWVDGPKRSPAQVDPAVRARMGEMVAHYYANRGDDPPSLEPPAIGRLGEIGVPTLIIAADGDVPDVLDEADLLHAGIAGSRKEVIPDVAHVPNMERPELFNRVVLDFLGALGTAGANGL